MPVEDIPQPKASGDHVAHESAEFDVRAAGYSESERDDDSTS
ncbi:MAG: Uncharacterised protein [Cellulomonadaceae bacterium TMED98]|nr:MAG: Uncharacterised protein [Cellulomonadaceae bacterium TMED98]